MSSGYDVMVIGGGSPGEHCAGALAEGAVCASHSSSTSYRWRGVHFWACIPSKRRWCARGGRARRERSGSDSVGRHRGGPLPGATTSFRTSPPPARSVGSPSMGSTCFAVAARLAGTGMRTAGDVPTPRPCRKIMISRIAQLTRPGGDDALGPLRADAVDLLQLLGVCSMISNTVSLKAPTSFPA